MPVVEKQLELSGKIIDWSIEIPVKTPLYFCWLKTDMKVFKILVPRTLYPKVRSYLITGQHYQFKCREYRINNDFRYKWVGISCHRGTL